MKNAIEVKAAFVFAQVYADLKKFGDVFSQSAAVQFEEGGTGVPQELLNRKFIFETREGDNPKSGPVIGVMIYEITEASPDGQHFATVMQDVEAKEQVQVGFVNDDNQIDVSSVETLLVVAQSSVLQFFTEIEQPQVKH